jgi:hypothetical protein
MASHLKKDIHDKDLIKKYNFYLIPSFFQLKVWIYSFILQMVQFQI